MSDSKNTDLSGDPKQLSGRDVLQFLEKSVQTEFETNRRVLTFEEYLNLFYENAERFIRNSAQYAVDMMDFYGKNEVKMPEGVRDAGETYRFKIFDLPVDGIAPKVVGQEQVQTEVYNALKSFARQGMTNRLVLLHGPNGSAKSTIVHSIMAGLERYSETQEGALYTFNWVFPIDRHTRSAIGLKGSQSRVEPNTSYAKFPEEEIAARIPSELKDHPILIIPKSHREHMFKQLLGEARGKKLFDSLPGYLRHGDLSHRCKQIFEALLNSQSGDLHEVLRHVQVERFFLSRRYRSGLVTVEPQLHVDANYNLLTYNKSINALPVSLQNINLFTLTGDLVDGNRGLIEYSDLLKRPVDSFKYLLVACETGSVNVGASIAHLDTVMLGSSNELQLDAFKEFPDFSSFKARIDLIQVPYLLKVSEEQEIYDLVIKQTSAEKHVAPHTDWALALWAVLTRLKKPNSINYPPNISGIISNLSPLQKARLYDTGEMPETLSAEERKLLRSQIARLRNEYGNIPYYEGRMGASVREVKSLIFDALQNPEFECLSPLAIFKELSQFVQHVSEYEFLKQDVKDGYHDAAGFINIVRNEYLNKIDREVRDSIGLYDSRQWEDFLGKYVTHVSHSLKKEKIYNAVTGKSEDPDQNLISEFEKIVEAPQDEKQKQAFRQSVISTIGAWSLDNPNEQVKYSEVFPEYWGKLENHYFDSQKSLLKKMHSALLLYKSDEFDKDTEGAKLAKQAVDNMTQKKGYCEKCARDIISFLLQKRY